MNLLFTLDENYLHPLKVTLKSLFINNKEENIDVYIMHSKIPEEKIEDLNKFINFHKGKLHEIKVSEENFNDATLTSYYTKEMYYYLISHLFLPKELDKILYLDPDLLILNSLKNLYEKNIDSYLFLGAYHNTTPTKTINKIRFLEHDLDKYYNAGVLLINLKNARKEIKVEDISSFIEENSYKLILPDQDVLNALYSNRIKSIDEKLYNYDVRYFNLYKLMDNKFTIKYIVNNTSILHFCGDNKPWEDNYTGKFGALYSHYEKLTNETKYKI